MKKGNLSKLVKEAVLLRSGDVPVSTIAEQFRVARSTLYRNVAVNA